MGSLKGKWALILGASSGFGAATSRELSKQGMNIIGVHLDRRNTLPNAEKLKADIEANGGKALFFNVNAADAGKRADVLDAVAKELNGNKIHIMMHSLAFGTLKPLIGEDPKECISQDQLEMTMDVMANSLIYWSQAVFSRGLFTKGSRVYAMTSSGGTRVWPSYGAVSAAKAALESHIRQLSLEFAPHGIIANTIRAGVTDTPALRKIPGSTEMIEFATARNPYHRLTTPEDVAKAIAAFSCEGSEWMTGNVIGVDGGEDIVG